MPQKYTPEFKARALKLIEERVRAEQCSGWVACTAVGEALGGISPHTLRNWWKQDRIDQGEAPGLSTAEAEEITKLRRENLELRRANEMAFCFSSSLRRLASSALSPPYWLRHR